MSDEGTHYYGDGHDHPELLAQPEPDDQLSPVDGLPEVAFPYDDTSEEAVKAEAERLDQAAAVRTEHRRLLSEPSANIGRDDRPHFLRTVDGKDVCGQDGKPWPCPEWEHGETVRAAEALGVSVEIFLRTNRGQAEFSAEVGTVDLEAAARVAGMSVEDFRRALAQEG